MFPCAPATPWLIIQMHAGNGCCKAACGMRHEACDHVANELRRLQSLPLSSVMRRHRQTSLSWWSSSSLSARFVVGAGARCLSAFSFVAHKKAAKLKPKELPANVHQQLQRTTHKYTYKYTSIYNCMQHKGIATDRQTDGKADILSDSWRNSDTVCCVCGQLVNCGNCETRPES